MLQIDTTHSNKRGRKENKKPLHLNADCDVVVYVCIHMYYRARLELRIFLMAIQLWFNHGPDLDGNGFEYLFSHGLNDLNDPNGVHVYFPQVCFRDYMMYTSHLILDVCMYVCVCVFSRFELKR